MVGPLNSLATPAIPPHLRASHTAGGVLLDVGRSVQTKVIAEGVVLPGLRVDAARSLAGIESPGLQPSSRLKASGLNPSALAGKRSRLTGKSAGLTGKHSGTAGKSAGLVLKSGLAGKSAGLARIGGRGGGVRCRATQGGRGIDAATG